MTTTTRVAELAALVDTELGTSAWRTVTQPMVDSFAELTGDFQWIHVDATRAAAGPFGGTVAHGMLTLAFVPPMIDEVLRVEDATFVVNKGFGRVRMANPVRVGACVRGVVRLCSTRTRPHGFHEVGLSVTVRIEGETGSALTAEPVLLYQRGDVS
jgi:acyl dehydratase